MPVTTRCPKYEDWRKRWELVRKVVANDAKCYIRTVDDKDIIRSQQYKDDAILTNFTKLTKEGLTGLVFAKEGKIELPAEIEYLKEDATGENLKLNQLSNRIVGEVLQTGRYGLLADYPKATPDLVGAEKEKQGFVARIKGYTAESIINYKMAHIGSKYMLSMVTLLEQWPDPNSTDMFEWDLVDRYRVLYLDFAGRYTQMVVDENENIIEALDPPTDFNGKVFKEIPFVILGSENNDPEFDSIPLYDTAILNIGHYRNSADVEEASFIAGQPFPVVCVGESSPTEFDAMNPSGVKFGSRGGLTVANGGSAQLLQANPNQLPDTLMKRKEEQAAAIGARLIAPPGGRETAEGAKIRYGSQNSSLYILTSNISNGIAQVLRWCCAYQGANPNEVVFELNNQFYDENADPNVLAQMWLGLDRGVYAPDDVRNYSRRVGILDAQRTNEAIEAEAVVAPIADPLS